MAVINHPDFSSARVTYRYRHLRLLTLMSFMSGVPQDSRSAASMQVRCTGVRILSQSCKSSKAWITNSFRIVRASFFDRILETKYWPTGRAASTPRYLIWWHVDSDSCFYSIAMQISNQKIKNTLEAAIKDIISGDMTTPSASMSSTSLLRFGRVGCS
jgi:hypothetical protein